MNKSSLAKLIFFALAIYANLNYAFFILNPIHIGNPLLYTLDLVANLISIVILTFAWISCIHFELMKDNYFQEIELFKGKGKYLLKNKVSILVPVVNEDIMVVQKTLKAVVDIKGSKEIFLLDDGKRDDLKDLAHTMNINYLRREGKEFFKSGNLNHGLAHVKTDYVVVFDADFCPKENFLEETMPLFVDETIGAVQTPQVYENRNNLFTQGMLNFQNIFYKYILPSKHLLNSAFCVGTNVIYRKSAIDAIGGIPLINHSEDVFTSLKLNEYGYRIFYLRKILAIGLAPNNIISFFNQQFRWARGGLTMLFKHNTLFNKNLKVDQKIQYFFSNLYYLTGISTLLFLINPLIAIITDAKPINEAFFYQWIVAYSLVFIFNFAFYALLVKKNRLQSMALGLFLFIPYLSALLSVIFSRKFTWKPTNFLGSGVITKLTMPLISYSSVCVFIVYLFSIGILEYKASYTLYSFWAALNLFLILYFIYNSYKSVFFNKND